MQIFHKCMAWCMRSVWEKLWDTLGSSKNCLFMFFLAAESASFAGKGISSIWATNELCTIGNERRHKSWQLTLVTTRANCRFESAFGAWTCIKVLTTVKPQPYFVFL